MSRTIEPTCCMSRQGKVKALYPTREDALAHVNKNNPLVPYRCVLGDGWHLRTARR